MSKAKIIEERLLETGSVSNIGCLSGNPVWTSRLGAIICNLRKKYDIETEVIRVNKQYVNTIYHLKGTKGTSTK